jgi:PIN domain nuclease of toxin-antitoxin system
MAITKRTIKDFDSSLQAHMPLDIPVPDDLLTDSDAKIIKDMFDIISKYNSSSWISDMSITEMRADLLQLQSMLVTIMYKFGSLTSYVEGIDEQLKIARSKVRINARTMKQNFEDNGESVAITLDDLKDLSYVKTETIWAKFEKARIGADFVKYIYFAAKDHVQVLNNTIQGLSRLE